MELSLTMVNFDALMVGLIEDTKGADDLAIYLANNSILWEAHTPENHNQWLERVKEHERQCEEKWQSRRQKAS